MKHLDIIHELLGDSQLHNIEEIKKEIPVPDDELNDILSFLQESGFIDNENSKLKITRRGLKLLELPIQR